MTVIIAPIFGPIIGGYICDNYDWGWIFLINVPLGVIVVVLTSGYSKAARRQLNRLKLISSR